MKVFVQVLLLGFILGIRMQAQDYKYKIIRRSKDRFKLPSFLCTVNWRDKCVAMGGANTNKNCTCKCTKGNNNVFGYFDNSWKCASNHDVRQNYSECSPEWFDDLNSPLKVVVPGDSKRKKIGTLFYYCKLESQMSYLNCYGKWEKFSQNSSVGFELENREDLYHKGKDRFNEYTPKINGNVIKLHLSCQVDVQNCVLLKVNGTQNCKVDSTTTSSPPTTSATTAQLPQTTTSTTTSTSFSDTSTNQQTTAISITKAERLSTTSSTESTPEHPMPTRHFSETKTTDAITSSPQKEKSASNGGSSGGAIEGAIGGVVALVVIVVILIVILKRRRKRCAKEKRESVAPIADNPSYHNASPANGQLEFPDDDEYSYACTNNHPIVIKEQNGKAVTGSNVANDNNRNINGVLGSPPNQQAPVYSTLEDPNYAKLQKSANTSNGPSYNVLARPENKWTAKQGPVYDVLEDPNTLPNKNGPIYNTLKNPNEPSYNTLERPENKWMTKQGPVYDILEDPNSTGGPVYSVLEGPNSNDQQAYDALEGQDTNVYGSLDSPDPHVYGALYSPTSKSASAYDNDIYDSAGGTIIDEDTYQELNQTDQRSSDIYQPVRPPRNTMAMKNMSGITQSQA